MDLTGLSEEMAAAAAPVASEERWQTASGAARCRQAGGQAARRPGGQAARRPGGQAARQPGGKSKSKVRVSLFNML